MCSNRLGGTKRAYPAHQFQGELAWLGIRSTPSYIGEPECDAFVERAIRTMGEPLNGDQLDTFAQAEQPLDEIIDWYSNRRLHSGIHYVTSASVRDGTADRCLAECQAKLAAARHRRREETLKIRQQALPLPTTWEFLSPERTANQPVSYLV